nr:putative efflux pump kojt [Quercus suber]
MITQEPTVMLLGGWLVGEYLVVFGFLQGFNYIFGETYDFSRGFIGTSFASLGLGCTLWTCGIPIYYYLYKRKVSRLHQAMSGENDSSLVTKAASPGKDLPDPEYRLWSAVLAAPAFPISLFWTTADIDYSYQYLLDTYGIYAGSALAVVTCCRYLASGFINLVSRPMYDGIGVHWTMTLLGCLAVLQMPLPLIFYHYGPSVRKRSAFAGRRPTHGSKWKPLVTVLGSRFEQMVGHHLWEARLLGSGHSKVEHSRLMSRGPLFGRMQILCETRTNLTQGVKFRDICIYEGLQALAHDRTHWLRMALRRGNDVEIPSCGRPLHVVHPPRPQSAQSSTTASHESS